MDETNKLTRFILVGYGRAGKKHLEAIEFYEKKGKAQLVGLVEPNMQARSEFQSTREVKSEEIAIADNLDELYRMNKLARAADIVSIATPPNYHAEIVNAAIDKSVDVIVEKPMTLRQDEAKDLVKLSDKSGHFILPCLTFRFYPAIKELKNFLASAALGNLLSASITVRWGHDQAYYEQAPWFGTWEAEGGALMNQTIHALDLVFYLIGEMPIKAMAKLAPPYHEIEAADLGLGIYTLKSGALVSVEGSTITDPKKKEAQLFMRYEKGSVRAGIRGMNVNFDVSYDDKDKKEPALVSTSVKRLIKRDGLAIVKQLNQAHTLMYGEVIAALQEKAKVQTQPFYLENYGLPLAIDGLNSLNLVLALLQSAKEGQEISFPPENFELSEMKEK